MSLENKDAPTSIYSLAIDFTVYYAVQPPEEDYEEAPALVVVLHGYGQKCRGFLRQFTALRRRNLLLVAPQGPHQIYMQLEPKKVGFNWLTVYEKENSIRDFIGYMTRLVDAVGERHAFDPDKVFVLGFSQGVSMAYRLLASQALKLKGVVACCSDIPADVVEALPRIAPVPVLLAHSPDDPFAPPQKGDEAECVLSEHRFPVTRLVYEGGHVISPELAESVGVWLEERTRELGPEG